MKRGVDNRRRIGVTFARQAGAASAEPLAVRDPIQNSCPRRDVINPAALRPIPIRLHNDMGRQHAGHSDRPANEVHR